MKPNNIVVIMVLASFALRFANAPLWNFSALAGLALYAGAHTSPKFLGLGLVLLTRLFTDTALGFYDSMSFDYMAYIIIFMIGHVWVPKTPWTIAGSSIVASCTFFTLSNYGVWWCGNMYSHDLPGLLSCYIMGLPFAVGTFYGDILSTLVAFALHRQFVEGPKPVCDLLSSSTLTVS